MDETRKNIDIIRDMLNYCGRIDELMRHFNGTAGFSDYYADFECQAVAAFCVVRINILRKWLSEDFNKAYPAIAEKMEVSEPGIDFPERHLLWNVLIYEIPRRSELLTQIVNEYSLLTKEVRERGFPPPAKME